MIVLLAIGIHDTPLRLLNRIEPAGADARSVYDTFALAAAQGFDHRRSVVLVDVTADEVRHFVRATTSSLSPDDLLLFYFSGHGERADDDSLMLCCRDADATRRGYVSSGEIRQLLGAVPGQACLAILDCCHSGAALAEANVRGLYEVPKLSVLVSARAYGQSSFDANGSFFTRALVRAVQVLASDSRAVGLVDVVKHMQSDRLHSVDVFVNPRHGSADVELVAAHEASGAGFQSNFADAWLRRVQRADVAVREFLWLDLARAPDNLKEEILRRFKDSEHPREPSWRVRRAIGELIRSIEDVSERKARLTLEFLQAHDWMDRCIGLAASRVLGGDARVRQAVAHILLDSGSRMDEVWLAHLYLSEMDEPAALESGISAALMTSPWGVIDFWRRHAPHHADLQALASRLVDAAADMPQALSSLALHIALDEAFCVSESESRAADILKAALGPEDLEFLALLRGSRLAKDFYTLPASHARPPVRGSTPLKWTMYDLYARWRDDFRLDLRAFLGASSMPRIREELCAFRCVPLVEFKMGLCRSLLDARPWSDEEAVRDAMAWALAEPHPWVRREATPLFAVTDARLRPALAIETDPRRYPGIMDLLLQAAEGGVDVSDELVEHHASAASERRAVRWALGVERS